MEFGFDDRTEQLGTELTPIVRDGDDYVLNGRKWWITGATVTCRA